MDSVFCAGATHAIHLCGVVFGVPAVCDGNTGLAPISAPMLPVPCGNDLNEALSSFSYLSDVGHIWWLDDMIILGGLGGCTWTLHLVMRSCYSASQLVLFLACCISSCSSSRFYSQQMLKPGGDEEDSPSLAFKRLQELEARDRRFRDKFPRCNIELH